MEIVEEVAEATTMAVEEITTIILARTMDMAVTEEGEEDLLIISRGETQIYSNNDGDYKRLCGWCKT